MDIRRARAGGAAFHHTSTSEIAPTHETTHDWSNTSLPKCSTSPDPFQLVASAYRQVKNTYFKVDLNVAYNKEFFWGLQLNMLMGMY